MYFYKIIICTLIILFCLGDWNYSSADNFFLETDAFDLSSESARQKFLKEIVILEGGRYKFGDDLYYPSDIEQAFFIVAFSERRDGHDFFKNAEYPRGVPQEKIEGMSKGAVKQYIDPKTRKNYVDWEYIENSINGIPKYNVLNKWTKKEISISFLNQNPDPLNTNEQSFLIAETALLEAINSINENTDLSLIYDESQSKKSDIIIVFGWTWPKNAYALGKSGRDWEGSLYGKVIYAPNAQMGVKGFFLPNEKNEIIKSFCYLDLYHKHKSSAEIQAHVKECLIRSLGLPDAMDNPKNSQLKSSVLLAVNDLESKIEHEHAVSETRGYSKFDLILLRKLYCPLRSAGDDYYSSKFKGYKSACAYDVLKFNEAK